MPLLYQQALCYVACYKPTPTDLETLQVHDVTTLDHSWKPSRETAAMTWYQDDKTGTNLNDYDTWNDFKTAHANKKTSAIKKTLPANRTKSLPKIVHLMLNMYRDV